MFKTKKNPQTTKHFSLEVFDRLLDLKESLGSPPGLVHFLVKNKGIAKASFNTLKNKDGCTILNLAFQVNSLSSLPSLATLLGDQWSGEVVLSATYVDYNEVPLILQTQKTQDSCPQKETVYSHSKPTLLAAITEILHEGKQIQHNSQTITEKSQSAISQIFLQATEQQLQTLHSKNEIHSSKIRQQLMNQLIRLRNIGALQLFQTLSLTSRLKCELILRRRYLDKRGWQKSDYALKLPTNQKKFSRWLKKSINIINHGSNYDLILKCSFDRHSYFCVYKFLIINNQERYFDQELVFSNQAGFETQYLWNISTDSTLNEESTLSNLQKLSEAIASILPPNHLIRIADALQTANFNTNFPQLESF